MKWNVLWFPKFEMLFCRINWDGVGKYCWELFKIMAADKSKKTFCLIFGKAMKPMRSITSLAKCKTKNQRISSSPWSGKVTLCRKWVGSPGRTSSTTPRNVLRIIYNFYFQVGSSDALPTCTSTPKSNEPPQPKGFASTSSVLTRRCSLPQTSHQIPNNHRYSRRPRLLRLQPPRSANQPRRVNSSPIYNLKLFLRNCLNIKLKMKWSRNLRRSLHSKHLKHLPKHHNKATSSRSSLTSTRLLRRRRFKQVHKEVHLVQLAITRNARKRRLVSQNRTTRRRWRNARMM
jgi:hypothetical protein